MQCYSALTVIPKGPVAMPNTEVGMKTSTGSIKNEAKRWLCNMFICSNSRKKHSLKTKAGFVGSGSPPPQTPICFSHKILLSSCHKTEIKITHFLRRYVVRGCI